VAALSVFSCCSRLCICGLWGESIRCWVRQAAGKLAIICRLCYSRSRAEKTIQSRPCVRPPFTLTAHVHAACALLLLCLLLQTIAACTALLLHCMSLAGQRNAQGLLSSVDHSCCPVYVRQGLTGPVHHYASQCRQFSSTTRTSALPVVQLGWPYSQLPLLPAYLVVYKRVSFSSGARFEGWLGAQQ
jgi:hypothetical protein